jgi:hypothetical protein
MIKKIKRYRAPKSSNIIDYHLLEAVLTRYSIKFGFEIRLGLLLFILETKYVPIWVASNSCKKQVPFEFP